MNVRKIASVGMNEQHTRFFQQLLKLYDGKLKNKWLFELKTENEKITQTLNNGQRLHTHILVQKLLA